MTKSRIIFIMLFLSCLSVVYSQVGIGIEVPTAMLDVAGEVKVRTINESSNVQDVVIVVDKNGYLKKKRVEALGVFKGYLSQDVQGNNNNVIKKIENFNVLHNPNVDFNSYDSGFTAPIDGIYKFIITATLRNRASNISQDYLGLGLVDETTGAWLSRFDVAKNFTTNRSTGFAVSFTGVVNLKKNQTCYFGLFGNADILYYPVGPSGTGLGTYFEITLL